MIHETINVYDRWENLVESISVTATGQFQTSNGLIEARELGSYLLRIIGHPAGQSKPKAVGEIPGHGPYAVHTSGFEGIKVYISEGGVHLIDGVELDHPPHAEGGLLPGSPL
jgi:hypothetical protein